MPNTKLNCEKCGYPLPLTASKCLNCGNENIEVKPILTIPDKKPVIEAEKEIKAKKGKAVFGKALAMIYLMLTIFFISLAIWSNLFGLKVLGSVVLVVSYAMRAYLNARKG